MSLHREDRELQIRLAELQADVQICVTASFGLFTGLLAVIIAATSPYIIHPQKEIILLLVGFACAVGPVILFWLALKARRQMEELRAKYVW